MTRLLTIADRRESAAAVVPSGQSGAVCSPTGETGATNLPNALGASAFIAAVVLGAVLI